MQVFQGIVSVRGGKIRELKPAFGHSVIQTEQANYRFNDGWIIPGLVDAHIHLVGLGEALIGQIDLSNCQSAEECVAQLQAAAQEREGWIVGRGWDQERWPDRQLPTRQLLDAVFNEQPVFLLRVDGHAAWVNTAALRRAQINAATSDPAGGQILRDSRGDPTGILIDTAMELVRRQIPPPSLSEVQRYIRQAAQAVVQYGITEVHDMDVDPAWIPVFQQLAESGELPIRVQSYVRGQNDEWLHARVLPTTGELFRLVGVKLYADGALGSYGAALLQPYSDRPSHYGLLLLDESSVIERLEMLVEVGWDLAIHAIGDRANRLVGEWYAHLRQHHIADPTQRLRLEHAQIIHPEDQERLALFDILPSVQPLHCLADAEMAQRRLGDRCRYAYPWRSLRNAGSVLGAGSDAPVVSPNPWEGMEAFVHRQPPGWHQPFYPEERLTPEEALLAYTQWAQQLTNMHVRRGKLREGYDADLVVVDRNPLKAESFLNVRVLATFVGGQCVYQTPS